MPRVIRSPVRRRFLGAATLMRSPAPERSQGWWPHAAQNARCGSTRWHGGDRTWGNGRCLQNISPDLWVPAQPRAMLGPVGSALCKRGGRWVLKMLRTEAASIEFAGRAEPVAGERLMRILSLLSAGGETEPGTARLCDVCAEVADMSGARICALFPEVADMSGAGIMLMSDDAPMGSVCTTNKVSDLIEELQYELGEGPCVDAHHEGRPVLEPDLADPATPRWLAFSPPALAAGTRAVFGFPLQVGAARLGAMNLYRDRPGRLSD